jgi:hypothetical protein
LPQRHKGFGVFVPLWQYIIGAKSLFFMVGFKEQIFLKFAGQESWE